MSPRSPMNYPCTNNNIIVIIFGVFFVIGVIVDDNIDLERALSTVVLYYIQTCWCNV